MQINILVTLPSLLDVRLGTIYLLNKDAVLTNLGNGYKSRREDRFIDVDMEQYRELYKSRPIEALMNTVFTELFVPIRKALVDSVADKRENPLIKKTVLYIDVGDYDLTKREIKEIRRNVASKINSLFEVKILKRGIRNLKPEFIRSMFATVFMYDFAEWLDIHCEDLIKTPLPSTNFVIPGLLNQPLDNNEEADVLSRSTVHPFTATEMYLAELIGVEAIDVKYFSIVG